MENWIYASLPILGKVLISIIGVFSIIIFITRVSGLRTFAKMSSFDFASTIAMGSVLASVVLSTDTSLLKGGIALTGIVTFQSLFSYVVRKFKPMRKLLTNDPMILMYKGEILTENLKRTNVGEDNLFAKLREANVIHFGQVLAVVLESTGDMSVLHSSEFDELPEEILFGVKGIPENLTHPKTKILPEHLNFNYYENSNTNIDFNSIKHYFSFKQCYFTRTRFYQHYNSV